MHFWNIEELKEDIRSNKLSEKDRFIYALVYVVLCAAGMEIMAWMPVEDTNVWDSINSISNILIVLIGTIFAFRANEGANGADFLGRFFSISFVITIRFMVLLIPLSIALIGYYSFMFGEDEEVVTTFGDIVPFLVWYAALYWRVCKHIGDINN